MQHAQVACFNATSTMRLYIAVTSKHLYNQQLLSLCIEMVAVWRPAQLLGPILQSAEAP